ncbi:MAG: N-acetylneuraminate synthase family protein [Candidatus Gastranaerophilales bacterium]|nr:N-acetylneuraminate synthase family protein [Candidatus Gastranaerophilales bacterium]
MRKKIKVGSKFIGDGESCFVIGEIGINHNGSIDIAKKLIDIAIASGCDAVKFQKRTVEIVYTQTELEAFRINPFGETNGDLKRALELSYEDYVEIDKYCKQTGIIWFASCWDEEAVDFIDRFNPPCYKIASASLTDDNLIKYTKAKGKPILLSTGMSCQEEIDHAIEILGDDIVLYHCTSTYPTECHEINLNVITRYREKYNFPIGYSGHERGLTPTTLAVAIGAASVERHITLDRTLWGSDQAASLEPEGLFRLLRDIRQVSKWMGDGQKVVYDSEMPIIKKLRRVKSSANV